MSELLVVDRLYGGYGGADILKGFSLSVNPGEIVVVLGPNGAGKSTLMKAVFGLVDVHKGWVRFGGEDITHMAPNLIVRRGMSYVPQEHNVFPGLTVHENLEMGAYLQRGGIAAKLDLVYHLFPRLQERRKQAAGSMSGGERQMVAIGRALMQDARLLLLDEPTAGLSPLFTQQIFERITEINRMGIGILMVEQNTKQALGIAHRAYVLTMGRNRHHDTAANMLANREIAEMFLGG
jgi:branched-chain amino acid transport system ATP-binding protein